MTMRSALQIALWLTFAACCGMLGVWYGIGLGARTIGAIASENEAHEAFSTLRESIDVIGRNDLAAANEQHRRYAVAALVRLGSVTKAVVYWECDARQKQTLANAKIFFEQHPDPDLPLPTQFMQEGLSFCAHPAKR